MKQIKSLLFILFFAKVAVAQSIDQLDSKNGFRDIKLGTSVYDYTFIIKGEKSYLPNDLYYDRFSVKGIDHGCKNCDEFIVKEGTSNYTSVPGAKIFKIGINTYKNNIYEINLHISADLNTNYALTEFTRAFGEPDKLFSKGWNLDFSDFVNNKKYLYMVWKGKKVRLSISSLNGKHNRVAYWVCYQDIELNNLVEKEIKENASPEIKPIDKY